MRRENYPGRAFVNFGGAYLAMIPWADYVALAWFRCSASGQPIAELVDHFFLFPLVTGVVAFVYMAEATVVHVIIRHTGPDIDRESHHQFCGAACAVLQIGLLAWNFHHQDHAISWWIILWICPLIALLISTAIVYWQYGLEIQDFPDWYRGIP